MYTYIRYSVRSGALLGGRRHGHQDPRPAVQGPISIIYIKKKHKKRKNNMYIYIYI